MTAQTKVETSLIGALAKALPELEGAKKNKANPAFKSKYADIAAVIEAIEPIRAHGLWFRQVSHDYEDGAKVETFYIHESGQELSAGVLSLPAVKRDAQGFGSAHTYARRYALLEAFGLATEDDDGNAASRTRQQEQPNDRSIREKGNGPMKTHLDRAEKEINHHLNGCGDEAMLTAYTNTEEYKTAKALLEEYRPSALYGPPPPEMPEYVPIKARIAAMVREFRAAEGTREPSPMDAG